MKKLIAISVVFALVAGAVFAVEVSGSVQGTAYVLQGDTGKDSKVTSGGEMNGIRLDGSGENGDGNFGGYIRLNKMDTILTGGDFTGHSWETALVPLVVPSGNAWWKPIDQFKLLIGSNGGDGFYGKEGVTGWMFYQTVTDVGVAMGGGNVWGGGYGSTTYRSAFYGGDGGDDAVRLEIIPADIATINIKLPFFADTENKDGDKNLVADKFKKTHFQLDLHLDFGNIAVTYVGDLLEGGNQPTIYGYFGGSFGDLSLDVGLGFKFPSEDGYSNPINIGVGVKYALETLGVKFRTVASLAGDNKSTDILAEVMPYFVLGDNLTAFVGVGLAMGMPDVGDTVVGWHFNPYLQVGEEWGAKFLAGIKVWSDGKDTGDGAIVNWAVPVALNLSF